MVNKYRIDGDVTYLQIKHKGEVKEFMIDTEDLQKIIDFNRNWYIKMRRDERFLYVETSPMKKRKRTIILLHRFITNCPEGKVVDHINHNTLDNRKQNLRVCTHRENMSNINMRTAKYPKEYVSGIRFVSWDKEKSKWAARYELKGVRKRLGYYVNIEDAKKAVDNYLASL